MKRKRIMCLLLALALCFAMYPAAYGSSSVSADLTDGVLTLSGSGSVADYAYWNDTDIVKVIIGEGITSIGKYSFSGCTNLTEISLPSTIRTIEGGAFQGCSALATVYYAGTTAEKENISISASYNDAILNARWICSDTVQSVTNSFSFTSAEVTSGDAATATVSLSLDEACTNLGAKLVVSAADADGNALAIDSVELGDGLGGETNDENDGTIVLACTGQLAAGTLLATIVFKTPTAGLYALSLSGEAYTGANNAPLEYSVNEASITVVEPTATVTWRNYDGKTLKSETVDLGTTPVYSGDTPAKPSDTLYTYTFSGWSPAVTAVTGDAVYTAQFTSSPRTYSVSIGCGIEGAKVSVTDSSGKILTPDANGHFSLVCGESYSVSVKAVGYDVIETSISVADQSGAWSYSGDSAVLTLGTPEMAIGDVDDDGDVDMTDAQALYNYLAGNCVPGSDGIAYGSDGSLIFNSNVADINGNGSLGADDILPMLELVNAGAAS